MARQEHDREDLLAEATALVERVALRLAGDAEETVAGFRRDGGASLYFGPNRSYQFTAASQLRRAYSDELLYKADRGKLVALDRHRTPQAVELVRHELDADETRVFLDAARGHLDRLQKALEAGRFTLVGQVPEAADVVGRVRDWLIAQAGQIAIASSPRAG